jgi:uncharacterized protein (TIGR02145 family)
MNTTIKTGLAAILLLAASCKKVNSNLQSSVTDNNASDMVAGKYAAIRIGIQKWMTTNLAVSRYRNGDHIPQVKDPIKWANLTTGGWCWYNNDSATSAVYGKLYNWYAVNDPRGLAPTGWHVPSDAEWDTLSTHLGDFVGGGKLKDTGTIEAGTGLWHAPNTGATNKTGFTGLPGGQRGYDGSFYSIGYLGSWWSSTQAYTDIAVSRYLLYSNGYINGNGNAYRMKEGYSIRCIKDSI